MFTTKNMCHNSTIKKTSLKLFDIITQLIELKMKRLTKINELMSHVILL